MHYIALFIIVIFMETRITDIFDEFENLENQKEEDF